MGQLGEFLAEEMLKKQDQIDEVNAIVNSGTYHQWNNGTRGEEQEIAPGDDLASKMQALEQLVYAGDDGYGNPSSTDPTQPASDTVMARLDDLEDHIFSKSTGGGWNSDLSAGTSLLGRVQALESAASGSGSGGGGDTTGTFDQMLAAFNGALTDGQNSFWYDDGSAYVSQSGGGSQSV
jgi:hypothetical protein